MTNPANKTDGPIDAMAVPFVTVDWYRSAPWWRFLSRSITASWRLSHLAMAAIAFLLTTTGWNIANNLFQPDPETPTAWVGNPAFSQTANSDAYSNAPKDALLIGSRLSDSTIQTGTWWRSLRDSSPIIRAWSAYVQPAADLLGPATARRWAFILFGTIWTAIVWGVIGGTISRRAMVELGTGGTVGIVESFRVAMTRLKSMIWCISSPLLFIGLFMLIPLVLGLIGRTGSIGEVIGALGMILAIPLMISAGWLAVMAAACFPLGVVAIVTEKRADAFEGLSRSSAYFFQRPATVAIGLLVATALGFFMQGIVQVAGYTGREFMMYAFEVGYNRDLSNFASGDPNSLGLGILWLAYQGITLIVVAAPFSYFWCAAAGLYLTLRREVDNIDFDDFDTLATGPKKSLPEVKNIAKPTGIEAEMDVAE
jgi:hypothetical protein